MTPKLLHPLTATTDIATCIPTPTPQRLVRAPSREEPPPTTAPRARVVTEPTVPSVRSVDLVRDEAVPQDLQGGYIPAQDHDERLDSQDPGHAMGAA